MIPVTDRGFTLGHGLFETVLFEAGEPVDWDAHLARLRRGCPVLGMPAPDPGACRRAADEALAVAGAPVRAAVRINWSAGSGGRGVDMPSPVIPRLTASAAAAPVSAAPLTLAVSRVRRNAGSPASRLKTLAYLDNVLARAEAHAAGADEALMLNTDGHVACAAVGNLFWIEGGAVMTPALDCGVLDGIMRGRVIAASVGLGLPVREVRMGLDAAAGRPMFVTNSLIGLRAVASLDGAVAPGSALVERLIQACRST